MTLGKLEEIENLRDVWPHEALNFTPWVAENVELLGEAVGLDITVDESFFTITMFHKVHCIYGKVLAGYIEATL